MILVVNVLKVSAARLTITARDGHVVEFAECFHLPSVVLWFTECSGKRTVGKLIFCRVIFLRQMFFLPCWGKSLFAKCIWQPPGTCQTTRHGKQPASGSDCPLIVRKDFLMKTYNFPQQMTSKTFRILISATQKIPFPTIYYAYLRFWLRWRESAVRRRHVDVVTGCRSWAKHPSRREQEPSRVTSQDG
jgi:hypothetical protein